MTTIPEDVMQKAEEAYTAADVTLSKLEASVFRAWEGVDADFGYLSFKAVSEDSGIELHRIRRAVRAIARKGLLQFSKGLWTDEGQLYGSGYGLTEAGKKYLNRIVFSRSEGMAA